MYEDLTKYLSMLEDSKYGEWGPKEQRGDGTRENPYQMLCVSYDRTVHSFIQDVYKFHEEHPEYNLGRYSEILEQNGIEWGSKSMEDFDVANADGRCVMGLLMGAVRAERFCDGVLLSFFKKNIIQNWLYRLKLLDE